MKSNKKLNVVQIEISVDKLESLFSKGNMCAAEIHCLNSTSKKVVWNLFLSVCAKKMHCNIVGFDCNIRCQHIAEKKFIKTPLESVALTSVT